MDYKINFTIEDICRELHKFTDAPNLEHVAITLRHHYISALWAVNSVASLFFRKSETSTLHQRAYVSNLRFSALLASEHIDGLLEGVLAGKGEPSKSGIERSARNLITVMEKISDYLPATQSILELGELSKKSQQLLNELDFFYNAAFYVLNSAFSPEMQRDSYRLDLDVKNFHRSQSLKAAPLTMGDPELVSIETKVDYFSNVVIHLIQNVHNHALNPGNDIEGRLKDMQFRGWYEINSIDDAPKKQIVVTVEDNGFGVSPRIRERLFERYASTKVDDDSEHGVGLWAAKQFVETHGGKMWFETELGKGTKFKFTIPYNQKVVLSSRNIIYKR